MVPDGRVLSLAAGTVLDASPEQAVAEAAAAGFQAVGLRWTPGAVDPMTVRRLLDDTGIALLDLEVVRLDPAAPVTAHRPLVEVAAALGARFLLAVSQHPDPGRTSDELAQLADWCAPSGVTVAVEAMRFTTVPTLAAAAALAPPGVALLVDALHLHRGGESPADLRPLAHRVGYLQLCDAPLAAPPGGVDALAAEARHARSFPGEGELPLADLVAALPADLPCSIEVQSDSWARATVTERARHAHATGRAALRRPGTGLRPGRARPTAGR